MSAAVESYLDQLNTTDNVKALYRRHGVHYGWMAMWTVIVAVLATLLASTIINVAIPQIMGAYGIGQDKAQWLATANLAAATVGMLMTSWMVGEWGLRNTLVTTMSLFIFGCLLGGFSPNFEVMVIARVIQGLSSGQVAPLSMTVIFILFPPRKMGMVMGISSVGAILAPALGPTIGGALIEAFNWRYVFFLSIPFSLACIPLALYFLPDRDGERPGKPFDWLGMVLLCIAITCLLTGLSNGEKDGWYSDSILLLLVSSALLGGAFISWQNHNANALLNLQLFRHSQFVIFSLTSFVFGAGLYGSTYLIPLFLQLVQGMGPSDAGLAMMPAGFAMGFLMPLLGRLADRYPAKFLISSGLLAFACSCYLMAGADANTGFWAFAWWMAIGRIGMALAIPAMNLWGVRSAPDDLMTQASGTLNFVRQLGGTFGINLLSLAITRRTQFHNDALAAYQTSDNQIASEVISHIGKLAAELGHIPPEQTISGVRFLAQMVYHQATTLSFSDSFLIATLVFMLTLIPAWFITANQSKASARQKSR